MSPHLILKHIISSDVSLAKLVSSSVALPAELVINVFLVLQIDIQKACDNTLLEIHPSMMKILLNGFHLIMLRM